MTRESTQDEIPTSLPLMLALAEQTPHRSPLSICSPEACGAAGGRRSGVRPSEHTVASCETLLTKCSWPGGGRTPRPAWTTPTSNRQD